MYSISKVKNLFRLPPIATLKEDSIKSHRPSDQSLNSSHQGTVWHLLDRLDWLGVAVKCVLCFV